MNSELNADGGLKHCRLWLRVLLSFVFSVLVMGVVLYLGFRLWPDKELELFRRRQNSTRFYDCNNELLYVMPLEEGLRREYYPLNEIPGELAEIFIREEDSKFWSHCGVDFMALARAFVQNKKSGHIVSGASTITMQLVRMVYPRSGSVDAGLKIREMLRAISMEAKLSKRQILELYLNNVPFGFQIEGVGSAARSFFGVQLQDLGAGQMEMLARIPRRPRDNAPQKAFDYPSECQHLVRHIISDYKSRNQRIPDVMNLWTDNYLAQKTERLLQRKLDEYKDARIHNGAVYAIHNKTGKILLWVGNASFMDDKNGGQIDGVLVRNQPGSSMKPFLYALALERGFSPNSVLADIPQDFGGSGVYTPANFNNRFNGPVLLRVSLASSLNVPAVYLLNEVGMSDYFELLEKLRFTSLLDNKDDIGLSLALGAGEVTLKEMVTGFSVFPNDGYVLKNESYGNCDSESSKKQSVSFTKVLERDTARIICDFLSDSSARTLGFGNASVFRTDYPSIFKTGTSNQYQNIIALGATTQVTVGVWMGNFAGETVIRETGSSIPANIVRDVLDELSRKYTPGKFNLPETYSKVPVCAISGMFPSDVCTSVREEFVEKSRLAQWRHNTCTWHVNRGGKTVLNYPSEYQHWASSKNYAGEIVTGTTALRIDYPRNNSVFVYDSSLPDSVQLLRILASGGQNETAVLWLDGNLVGTCRGVFSWNVPLSRGSHTLTVECGGSTVSSVYQVQ